MVFSFHVLKGKIRFYNLCVRSFSALHFLVDILPLDLRGKWNIKYTSLDIERGLLVEIILCQQVVLSFSVLNVLIFIDSILSQNSGLQTWFCLIHLVCRNCLLLWRWCTVKVLKEMTLRRYFNSSLSGRVLK